jgi:hypothetical protein
MPRPTSPETKAGRVFAAFVKFAKDREKFLGTAPYITFCTDGSGALCRTNGEEFLDYSTLDEALEKLSLGEDNEQQKGKD